MPDRKIFDMDDLANFELPPLPVRPINAKSPEELSNVVAAPVVDEAQVDEVLPELPQGPFDDELEMINDVVTDSLPETVEVPPDDHVTAIQPDFDFDFPPLRDPVVTPAPVPDEEVFVFEEKKPVEENKIPDEEVFDFSGGYDPNLDLDQLDVSGVVMEDMRRPRMTHGARTPAEESARNIREDARTSDLERETVKQVLDDLSAVYTPPQKKAESLVDKDKLNPDEKDILKRRLMEDLGRNTSNVSRAASKNMERKLMEEKKLKIAKKGMAISFIPVALGLIGAAICYLAIGWGDYEWLKYAAVAGVIGALALLIKSNQSKMFGIIMYVLSLLVYVGPGLVMYALDDGMANAPDRTTHIILASVASIANIASLVILSKVKSVDTYYSTKFSKK